MNKEELIQRLHQTRSATLPCFEFSNEDLQKRYRPEAWTVRQILHHISDSETLLFDRIRRAISEPGQVLFDFDQDLWVEKLDYDHRPMSLSKNLYDSTREAILYYGGIHYEMNGHLHYVHSKAGIRTLKETFAKVVEHNETHLRQIEKSLRSGT